jgi:hypothetical protein
MLLSLITWHMSLWSVYLEPETFIKLNLVLVFFPNGSVISHVINFCVLPDDDA